MSMTQCSVLGILMFPTHNIDNDLAVFHKKITLFTISLSTLD